MCTRMCMCVCVCARMCVCVCVCTVKKTLAHMISYSLSFPHPFPVSRAAGSGGSSGRLGPLPAAGIHTGLYSSLGSASMPSSRGGYGPAHTAAAVLAAAAAAAGAGAGSPHGGGGRGAGLANFRRGRPSVDEGNLSTVSTSSAPGEGSGLRVRV